MNEMKKKMYVKPTTECYQWEPVGFLANSPTGGDAGGLIGGNDDLEAKEVGFDDYEEAWFSNPYYVK